MTEAAILLDMIDFVDARRTQSCHYISGLQSCLQVDDATRAWDCVQCETSWYCAGCKLLHLALQA